MCLLFTDFSSTREVKAKVCIYESLSLNKTDFKLLIDFVFVTFKDAVAYLNLNLPCTPFLTTFVPPIFKAQNRFLY